MNPLPGVVKTPSSTMVNLALENENLCVVICLQQAGIACIKQR